mgnify:CR=1 FL=1
MELFTVLVGVISLTITVQSLQVTACNCTQAVHKGLIGFREDGCSPSEIPELPLPVDHVMYSYQKESIRFPGYFVVDGTDRLK